MAAPQGRAGLPLYGGSGVQPGTQPVPPAPTGRDPLATQGPNGPIDVNIWAMPVKMRQQFLNSHGYKVKVDGKAGPQTLTAGKAFVKGIPAAYWNKVWHENHPVPVAGTGPGAAAPGSQGDGSGALPADQGSPNASYTYDPTSAPQTKIPGLGNVSLIDPSSYTKNAMDAKYSGPQADLVRQLAQSGVDMKGHQEDIKNWFASILGDQKSGAAANVSALGGILKGADASNLGLVNALGGSENAASANVASLGQIGRNALTQRATDQANFDDSQKTAIAQQGVDVANQEWAKGSKAKAALLAQQLSLDTTRGADTAATLSGAQQDRFKQQLALHDAQVSQSMIPGQLLGQTLDNKNKSLNTDYLQAKIDAVKGTTGGSIDLSQPTTANQFNDAITQTISDKTGSFNTDPNAAWIQVQHLLARNGLSSDPRAMQLAKQSFQDALARSHKNGQYKNWVFGPKGLVKIKAKTKK